MPAGGVLPAFCSGQMGGHLHTSGHRCGLAMCPWLRWVQMLGAVAGNVAASSRWGHWEGVVTQGLPLARLDHSCRHVARVLQRPLSGTHGASLPTHREAPAQHVLVGGSQNSQGAPRPSARTGRYSQPVRRLSKGRRGCSVKQVARPKPPALARMLALGTLALSTHHWRSHGGRSARSIP